VQVGHIKRIGVSALLALGVVAGSLGAFMAPSADAAQFTSSKVLYLTYFAQSSGVGMALRQACESSAVAHGVSYTQAHVTHYAKAAIHWTIPPKLVWYNRLDCIGYTYLGHTALSPAALMR
jgi:hypothetical protein